MNFLNIDLEVRSRQKLDAIVDALGDRVLVLHHSRVRGASFLAIETHSRRQNEAHGVVFRRWLALIGTLRGEPRRVLRAARVVASIGVEQEDERATSVVIDPEHVRALGRLGIAIEVVVYRAEKKVRTRSAAARGVRS